MKLIKVMIITTLSVVMIIQTIILLILNNSLGQQFKMS